VQIKPPTPFFQKIRKEGRAPINLHISGILGPFFIFIFIFIFIFSFWRKGRKEGNWGYMRCTVDIYSY